MKIFKLILKCFVGLLVIYFILASILPIYPHLTKGEAGGCGIPDNSPSGCSHPFYEYSNLSFVKLDITNLNLKINEHKDIFIP